MSTSGNHNGRPGPDADAEAWRRYADEMEGVATAAERRAQYLQDQLNHVISTPAWRFLRNCREFVGQKMLGRFPRVKKMAGVLAREGPAGVFRRLQQGTIGDARYQDFLQKHPFTQDTRKNISARIDAIPGDKRPLISVLVPVYNTPQEILLATIESIRAQIYPKWELCIVDDKSPAAHVRPLLEKLAAEDKRIRVKFREQNGNISRSTQDALDMAAGEFVAFVDHDDVLTPDALAEVALCIHEHPDADFIYSDHDMLEVNGTRSLAYFKPDWSPDTFLSNMYVCHLTVFRTELVKNVGGMRVGFEGSQDYDLVLRVTEKSTPQRIHHIPKVLYSWRKVPGSTAQNYSAKSYADDAAKRAIGEAMQRRGIDATVEQGLIPSLFRVKYAIKNDPLVSIMIPFRDHADMLSRCINSIREKTTYKRYELILIDNGSTKPETASLLQRETRESNTRVLRVDAPFNFSRLNNLGAREAKGEHLLLLNNDTEVIEPEWLRAMLEHSQRREVGAVGAKLLYPDGRIQHAGVIMGIGEVAGHSHRMVPDGDPGYFASAIMIKNYSAVTAACLMTRKTVFEELGGLNEVDLAVAYNDVDYCLRLREKGYTVVYTPYAKLKHYESVSRGFVNNPRESGYMCRRWAKYFNDPHYHPSLNRSAEDFSLRM